jgi:chromosomal replication initiation ATPase DnaA
LALLKAVFLKYFADRLLAVEPHFIAHIALNLEKSLEAAASIVADIDRAALASHRRVTRALAAEVLARRQAGSG